MQGADAPKREISRLQVGRVGKVHESGDSSASWVVLDGAGQPIAPVCEYLRELTACGSSAASGRSYAYDLLRWFRFLAAVDVTWDKARRTEVRDFVLWLRATPNPQRSTDRMGAPIPGSVNAKTG